MPTIQIFRYDQLKSKEAKQKARDWYLKGEQENPTWYKEHCNSKNAALTWVRRFHNNEVTKHDLLNMARRCEFTGYVGDALLADIIAKRMGVPTEKYVEQAYDEMWELEMQSKESEAYISEVMLANDYRFTADGQLVPYDVLDAKIEETTEKIVGLIKANAHELSRVKSALKLLDAIAKRQHSQLNECIDYDSLNLLDIAAHFYNPNEE